MRIVMITVGLLSIAIQAACLARDERAAPRPAAPLVVLEPDELAFAARLASEELERWQRERLEVLRDALDPGELVEHTRRVRHIDAVEGRVSIEALFIQGETIFERAFTLAEGLGRPRVGHLPPALSRVEDMRTAGGPDARSCVECHLRGGDDGHGELHQRAWLDGDGRHLSSATPRVPPIVSGTGLVQALAAEMSAELQQTLAWARQNPGVTLPLTAKGISFGSISVRADGTVDGTAVAGVDADLVVRPFGWKGTSPTLRSFLKDALPRHMGLEPLPSAEAAQPTIAGRGVVGATTPAVVDAHAYLFDGDRDGKAGEVSEGQLTSLALYLALLDVPAARPPRAPDLFAIWTRGSALFDSVGCARCHVPRQVLQSAVWTERAAADDRGVTVDLARDAQVSPGIEEASLGRAGYEVPLYSDLKRHDLGSELAERPEAGVPATVWLTRPLWGLGDRSYFLHDGRARSFAQAVGFHGGEASGAREAYQALDDGDRRALDVFLMSLGRSARPRLAP